MASIEMQGLDEYLVKLSAMEHSSKEEICGKAIYEGAGIVADSIRAELSNLPTDERFGTTEAPAQGIKAIQKEGLLHSLGITSMKDDGHGFLHVKVGFDGYNRVVTKKWPRGQPNQMVARAAASGTTWLMKYPFTKKAVSSVRKKVLKTMETSVSKSIDEIWAKSARDAIKRARSSGKHTWES